jgi:hypothetical protein
MSKVRAILTAALFAVAPACGAPPIVDTDAATTDGGATDTSVDDAPRAPDASCLCNCPPVPGVSTGGTRDDWPSCGLPGSGETYARCCGI